MLERLKRFVGKAAVQAVAPIMAFAATIAIRGRKGVGQIGALIMSLVVAMVTIFIALLLGGVLSSQINTQFTAFNVTGTWLDLFTTTQQIATSSISIAVIGFLVAAFMVVLAMLGVFGGKRR